MMYVFELKSCMPFQLCIKIPVVSWHMTHSHSNIEGRSENFLHAAISIKLLP